jgi:hypothetical protein
MGSFVAYAERNPETQLNIEVVPGSPYAGRDSRRTARQSERGHRTPSARRQNLRRESPLTQDPAWCTGSSRCAPGAGLMCSALTPAQTQREVIALERQRSAPS